MTIYILNILSLLVYLFAYNKSKDKKKAKIIIVLLITVQFVLIQGLRSFWVGNDTMNYVKYYINDKYINFGLFDLLSGKVYKFEPGYLLFMKICSNLYMSPRTFLVIIATIINVLLSLSIYKNSDNFILSYWVFIGIEYFSLSFTMLRQMIAICILLNAYTYLKKKDFVKATLITIVAVLFHKTAAIFFILIIYKYIYSRIKLKTSFSLDIKYKLIIAMVIYLMIYFSGSLINFVANKLYGNYTFVQSDLGTLFFVMLAILILCFIIEIKYGKSQELTDYQTIMLVASSLQLMTIHIEQIYRGALNIYVFAVLILPNILKMIKHDKVRKITTLTIFILTFAQYVIFSMDVYHLVPYSIF